MACTAQAGAARAGCPARARSPWLPRRPTTCSGSSGSSPHVGMQSEAATQAQQPWRWSAGRRSAPRRGSRAAARAAAEAPAVHPARLRLGADIPIALKPVTVAGCTFLLVVPDIDAVMEMYIAAGQADRDPYWCEPWPSALAMCEELLARPALVARKRACELGCGLGLAGLAAVVAGAAEVVLLDREPLALQCALLNARINGLATAPPSGSSSGVQAPSIEQLLPHLAPGDAERLQQHTAALAAQRQAAVGAAGGGGGASAAAGGGAPAGVVRAELFDWSQPVTLAPHDVMLVCDCLYEAFSVQPVAAVAPKLLGRREGRLLLADPPDRARHNRECFLDILCEESGEFLLEEASEASVRTWEESKQAWRAVPIALMHLRRAAGGDTVGVKLRRREQ